MVTFEHIEKRGSADWKHYDILWVETGEIIGELVFYTKCYEQPKFNPSKYGKSIGLKPMNVNMWLTEVKDILEGV